MSRVYAFLLYVSVLGMIWFPEYRLPSFLSALLSGIAVLLSIAADDTMQKRTADEPEILYSSPKED